MGKKRKTLCARACRAAAVAEAGASVVKHALRILAGAEEFGPYSDKIGTFLQGNHIM